MAVKLVTIYWSHYNDGISKTEVRGLLEVDTLADLPAPDDITGYRLTIGTEADIIDTAARYKMDSSGSWYVQEQGTDFYTKSEIDTMMAAKADAATTYTKTETDNLLAAKQDNLTVDQLAAVNSGITSDCLQYVVDDGQKNLLNYRRPDNTLNGVTFTNNPDGSISLSGIASAAFARQGTCLLSDIPTSFIGKTVRLTGGYNSSIRLRGYENASSTTAIYTDDGSGVNFTVTSDMINNPYQIRISISNGVDCNGVTIYPMIRDASLPGDNYKPYAPSNRELYEMILAI